MLKANSGEYMVQPGPSNWLPRRMEDVRSKKYGAADQISEHFATKKSIAILPIPNAKSALNFKGIDPIVPLRSQNEMNKRSNYFATSQENANMQVKKTKGDADTNSTKKKEVTPRFLCGSTEKVIKWYKISPQLNNFEVIAPLVNVAQGSSRLQKTLLLRSNKGPALKVVYYNTDWIHLPNFHLGQFIRCVGRMSDQSTLQAFKIREATTEEIENFTRINYICDQEVSNISRA